MLRGGFKAIHGDLLHIRFREKIGDFFRKRIRISEKGPIMLQPATVRYHQVKNYQNLLDVMKKLE